MKFSSLVHFAWISSSLILAWSGSAAARPTRVTPFTPNLSGLPVTLSHDEESFGRNDNRVVFTAPVAAVDAATPADNTKPVNEVKPMLHGGHTNHESDATH